MQTVQKIPDGYRALAEGAVWQQRVADAWQALGFQTKIGWGHDEADVILLEDAKLDQTDRHTGEPFPQERYMDGFFISGVVSVKTFTLVPSAQRYGVNGEIAFASSRTIKRKDVLPELEFAALHSLGSAHLTVINSRNGAAEHVEIYPFAATRYTEAFDHYSTSSRLTSEQPCMLLAGSFCYDSNDPGGLFPGWRRLCPSQSTFEASSSLKVEPSSNLTVMPKQQETYPDEEQDPEAPFTEETAEPEPTLEVNWSDPLAPNYFMNLKRRPA